MNENGSYFSPEDVPEINTEMNISSLHLSPAEGFLLSQVDGVLTVADLKLISNLPEKEFSEALNKLLIEDVLNIEGKKSPVPQEKASAWKSTPETATLEDKVRNLYLDLEKLTYYELLGLSPMATTDEIKKAFYNMTKEFHPDKFFRGDDEEIRERLQMIFARINDAYRLLMNHQKRAEYDRDLKAVEKPFTPEVTPPPAPPRKNPFMESVLKAKRLFEGAVEEIKRKNYAGARQNLRIASTIDPFNKKYSEAMSKLGKFENIEKAKTYHQAGLEHESEGRHKEAARLYREAMLLDADNSLYYTRLAKITFEQDGNPDAAKKLVQKAIELNPGDPEPYLILGKVFLEKRQANAAVAQFEKGLKIAPAHKEMARELKRAKKIK